VFGFWYPISKSWSLGVKALYKYLNVKTLLTDNLTSFHTNSLSQRDLTLASLIKHEFALIPLLTKRWDNFRVFFGLGPVLLDSGLSLRGFNSNDSLDITFGPFTLNSKEVIAVKVASKDKILWGGLVQVGFDFFINSRWYTGLSYNYLFSLCSNQSLPMLPLNQRLTDGGVTTVVDYTHKVSGGYRVTMQELMLTFGVRFK
jgi:hypothetical protein